MAKRYVARVAIVAAVLLLSSPGLRAQDGCTELERCTLEPGQSVSAVLSSADEVHFWTVHLPGSGDLSVLLTDLAVDYDLGVLGPDGPSWESRNEGTADDLVEVAAASPGAYTIGVRSGRGETSEQPYTLVVDWVPAPVVEPTAAPPTPTLAVPSPTPFPTATPVVVPLMRMATRVRADGSAIDPGTIFPSSTREIWAVFRADSLPPTLRISSQHAPSPVPGAYYAYLEGVKLPPNTSFGWRWFLDGRPVPGLTFFLDLAPNDFFWLQAFSTGPGGVRAPGSWEIVVELSGARVASSELIITP